MNGRLAATYGTAPLGNKEDPLDELIYIQLSIRTREGAYADLYEALRAHMRGDWSRLLAMDRAEAADVLRAGGMADVKVARLVGQLRQIQAAFGELTLAPLAQMTDREAEEFLTTLPGVGPKAARCVLMYSLGRDVFPVDSHCRRVLGRLGFLPAGIERKATDDYLQPIVPMGIRYTLHVNLIHHGRETCLPRNPACKRCVLLDLCPTGQARVVGSEPPWPDPSTR